MGQGCSSAGQGGKKSGGGSDSSMNLGELGRIGWREVGSARLLGSICIGWVDGVALFVVRHEFCTVIAVG